MARRKDEDDFGGVPSSPGDAQRAPHDTTPAKIAAAYEAIVGLGGSGALGEHATRMRKAFQRRTGTFGPEDPWFESRARAFWDDALALQGFAALASPLLDEESRAVTTAFARAHRGFFVVEEADVRGAHLLDLWSGAELLVRHLDETQALTLAHAEGALDGRVTSGPSSSDLFLLPGAYHHSADALEPALTILMEARTRGMSTTTTLDALLRMDLVLRSSSRVKAGFAYRIEGLGPASPPHARAR